MVHGRREEILPSRGVRETPPVFKWGGVQGVIAFDACEEFGMPRRRAELIEE
jgi:hypothetical protein